jgi:hypothetical protein
MLKLIRNVFSAITDWEPWPLQGQRVAVVVTFPPHMDGRTFILAKALRDELSFRGARAFIPEDNGAGEVANGVITIMSDFILSCGLTVEFGRKASEHSREISNQFLIHCWVWNKDGYGLSEKVFREFDSPCDPKLGSVFRSLASQAAEFAEETILLHLPAQETAA